MTENYP